MYRFAFYLILLVLFARALFRFWSGIRQGMTGGGTPTAVPQRGVAMVRDPVCGTFVVPERALTITNGREQVHFCSTTCRDKYRAKTA
jgi:YHS domain-containing protein